MSLETLLLAAEYLERRSGVESRAVTNDYQSYPASPVKRSSYLASNSQQDEDSEESGERKRWAGTREVHNKLEKNRRAHLKECFEQLRQEIPSIDDRKISNLSILQKALRFVQSITAKEKELEEEKRKLAAAASDMQAKLVRLKQEVKGMDVFADVDAWLAGQQDVAGDCSTSTASECGDEDEQHFEESTSKSSSRGIRKSWKTEASWPVTNGKVELKVLRVQQQQSPQQQQQALQQQPALQRMQHAAVRATLQQRLHMRVNADVTDKSAVGMSPSVSVSDATVGIAPAAPMSRPSSSTPPAVPCSSYDHNGLHSSALIRAARAAGQPMALAHGFQASGSGLQEAAGCRRRVVLSACSVPQQQQQQQQLFLLPATTGCGSPAHAGGASSAPLPSAVAIPAATVAKHGLAPQQPTAAQPVATTNGLVFSASAAFGHAASTTGVAAAAAAFPFFLAAADALRLAQAPSALSLVPCQGQPRDQQRQCLSAGGASSSALLSVNSVPQHPATSDSSPALALSSFRPPRRSSAAASVSLCGGAVMPNAVSACYPSAHVVPTSSLAAIGGTIAQHARGAAGISTSALHSPSASLAKQAPVHIVTAAQPYVLMMTTTTQDAAAASLSASRMVHDARDGGCMSTLQPQVKM